MASFALRGVCYEAYDPGCSNFSSMFEPFAKALNRENAQWKITAGITHSLIPCRMSGKKLPEGFSRIPTDGIMPPKQYQSIRRMAVFFTRKPIFPGIASAVFFEYIGKIQWIIIAAHPGNDFDGVFLFFQKLFGIFHPDLRQILNGRDIQILPELFLQQYFTASGMMTDLFHGQIVIEKSTFDKGFGSDQSLRQIPVFRPFGKHDYQLGELSRKGMDHAAVHIFLFRLPVKKIQFLLQFRIRTVGQQNDLIQPQDPQILQTEGTGDAEMFLPDPFCGSGFQRKFPRRDQHCTAGRDPDAAGFGTEDQYSAFHDLYIQIIGPIVMIPVSMGPEGRTDKAAAQQPGTFQCGVYRDAPSFDQSD